jgi:anti-sigma regulatory factor (Ser/Thr protein kinase)
MPEQHPHIAEARLVLDSRLEALKVVEPWVNSLAAEYAIPDKTRFAMDLCLEEALSNVIRHGYGNEPGHVIRVEFAKEAGAMTFTIEDSAPPFAPPEDVDLPQAPTSIEEVKPGSMGIPLMRKFAGFLKYERLADANRLTIGFPAEM